MELVSLLDANHQSQIYDKIEQAKEASLLEVWICMRSSSRNLSWYWLNKHPVNETDLAGHKPEQGQCVIMSTEREKDFSWSNRECCKKAWLVFYRPLIFFPI
ncbi:C-type lectin lectoxin-Phi1-like [Xyrichtys novacula]|uniref:C-type lectin lectoxin-Phi1-like n=1 Tax=Xyrichtys novacula TaxID=13765 RepID=A0AAV1FLC1_XYRNO|nr:C-type lectin lectoxin-Phi1-like [Xyrichtys novacula]